jgi:D-3-phosphoglycerate dehydrogenase
MNVVGYDPALSVEAAWRLPSEVSRMENLASLLSKCDFVSLHLPVLDSTRHLINKDSLANVKAGACLLNFAREAIVDTSAIVEALESGLLGRYIADFPVPELIGVENAILMPHIGASTEEAEDNCAVMAADQLKDFLENGNIINSVNFPRTYLERTNGPRLAISNKNVPKTLGSILSVLADANINVADMINKSRDDIAYNLIDLESAPDAAVLELIQATEGVIKVSLL